MTITADDIRAVYNEAPADDADMTGIITIVHELSSLYLENCGYSTTMVKAIEQYLAAHFLALDLEKGGLVRQRVGESEDRYREISLETNGIALTNYGQQALALDIKGCLSPLASKPLKAQFRVV